ncbi:venom metalloproteinase antarease TserMP_A-like [Amblyomma americanum]
MLRVVVLLHLLAWSRAEKELLVYPSVVEERTTDTNLVLRVSDDITLNLEKSSVLAERLLFATDAGSAYHLETIDTASIQENIYHDAHHQSSLHVHHEDGALRIEGIINHKLRIKPLAEAERSSQGQILHSLYETEEIKEDPKKLASDPHLHLWNTLSSNLNSLTPRPRNVSSFVVELHIISDEEHQDHFRTKEELITYLGVMTNAVNLRFLDMKTPSISFKLVGVTNSTNDNTFESHMVGIVEANETLYRLKDYYKNIVPGNPDVVYLITNRNLASISQNGAVNKNVAGLAFVGGVCTHARVAEGEDIAKSYDGVHTMAHELAHSVGAQHDSQEVNAECPWSKGFLMSYEDKGANKYYLSPCNKRQIKEVVQSRTEDCINEVAKTKIMVDTKFLPGQKVSEFRYCNMIMKERRVVAYAKKTSTLSSKCKMMCCYQIREKTKDESIISVKTMCREVDILEGMSCGIGKTCKRGECANHG